MLRSKFKTTQFCLTHTNSECLHLYTRKQKFSEHGVGRYVVKLSRGSY